MGEEAGEEEREVGEEEGEEEREEVGEEEGEEAGEKVGEEPVPCRHTTLLFHHHMRSQKPRQSVGVSTRNHKRGPGLILHPPHPLPLPPKPQHLPILQ